MKITAASLCPTLPSSKTSSDNRYGEAQGFAYHIGACYKPLLLPGHAQALQLLRQMMEHKEVDDKIEITENEAQEYYTKNKHQMSRPPKARIRYIRVSLGSSRDDDRRVHERIDEAYQKLAPGIFQDGADFEEVAREYSEDSISAA